MYRRSLSNLLGGTLLVATAIALNACGSEAGTGGDMTPSAGTPGTPTSTSAGMTGSTGTAGKTASAPTTTGTAGAKATAGTTSTTSGVMTAAGKSGGAGTAGTTGAASGGTSAAAGGTATATAGTGGAAGGGTATAGSEATSGGTLGGPLKYTGMFTMGMTIDKKYKCPMDFTGGMGDNKSPALSWTGGPADTKSFAIVLYDTMYNMLHWAMWDIPATVNMLPEGLPSGYDIATVMGAHQASNMGMDKHAYYGPCSGGAAAGTYEYRLYALKVDKLGLMESTPATMAQTAIEGMMLEKAVWAGKPM
ncbi:MAG TPA: YbhB/YbcL family Raf kinase inhibitor-like protein [Polyangiales bacterium]|nr:YbhB/YbcL family Raf kinase inhibitor-like protein [Polyangiales bacterium]